MKSILLGIFLSARPRHWIKNLAVFAPVFFAGRLFDLQAIAATIVAFVVFCLLSSSHYIFNDLVDIPLDRKHPYKKYRPIASGKLSRNAAIFIMGVLGGVGFFVSSLLGNQFVLIVALFMLLHIAGTLYLRWLAVIDILTIASGYVIRVYAGGAASNTHISIWLTIAMMSLAMLLAIGKRCAEFTISTSLRRQAVADVYTHYSEKLLRTYMAMFGTASFITYSYYTFLASPVSRGFLVKGVSTITDVYTERKWMMVTIPFVLYGIMRYLQLVFEAKETTLDRILTADRPLLATGFLWVMTVFMVVYGIGH